MGPRVLLVESDEPTRTSIVRALRARGVGVDAFAAPSEALAAVEMGGVVWTRALIDLALPEMDGATLAHRLLQHVPDLEITFATGGTDAAVLCRAHGLGTVIWKPLGLGPLCERLSVGTRTVSGTFARRGMRRSSSKLEAVQPPAASAQRRAK